LKNLKFLLAVVIALSIEQVTTELVESPGIATGIVQASSIALTGLAG
jgi:hypothetical protein